MHALKRAFSTRITERGAMARRRFPNNCPRPEMVRQQSAFQGTGSSQASRVVILYRGMFGGDTDVTTVAKLETVGRSRPKSLPAFLEYGVLMGAKLLRVILRDKRRQLLHEPK